MAKFTKLGYGQVEPNRIAGIKQGRVLADVPVKPETVTALGGYVENGIFLAWNPGVGLDGNLKKGELDLPKPDSTYIGLVYTDVKLYSQFTSNKDFALFTKAPSMNQATQSPYYDKKEVAHGTVIPRLIGLTVGDVFTTNNLEGTPEVGDVLKLNTQGLLDAAGTVDLIQVKVTDKTTLADGQAAYKVVVIAAKAQEEENQNGKTF